MQIQDAQSINEELGTYALPNGFVSVPVFTSHECEIDFDINYGCCPYASDETNYRRHNYTLTFNDYDWIRKAVQKPLG